MLKTVYLDHNATTPVHPDVKSQAAAWIDAWGNPSSIHYAGRGPKTLLRESRKNIARWIGAEPLELIFTSGGSEANNLALKGSLSGERKQVIISSVEHPSVFKTAMELGRQGYRIDTIPVNREGVLDLEKFSELLSEKTALVSVMLANNETGHIFPMKKITELAHAKGALVHCDAVQGLGKLDLNFRDLGVDMASISGHKAYALKGCGVLYVRRGLNIKSLINGGGQERGRRAGTENVLAIASLGYMATRADEFLQQSSRLRDLRNCMEDEILASIEGVQITGRASDRVGNTSSMVIRDVDGETLLMNLDVRGYAVSTGAACSSGNPEPSPVLLAMGLERSEAQSSLRLSLGLGTREADIDEFVVTLKAVVERLRGFKHGERFAYGL